jgi:hypothetical protein
MRMRRREFLALTASSPLARAFATSQADLPAIPIRQASRFEVVMKSPKPQPYGLQATRECLWILDQGPDCWAHLVGYDGKAIKGVPTEAVGASGITYDGEFLWLGSTVTRETIKTDASTGKAVAKYPTPPRPDPQAEAARGAPGRGGRGNADPRTRPNPLGTGARGQEWKDGKLWFASGPTRKVFRMDPQKWVVESEWPVLGDRAHGLGWEGDYLWVADGNLRAFHKHDSRMGKVIEQIKLASEDPEPHGMTIWDGYLWYSDTGTGSVLRAKLS